MVLLLFVVDEFIWITLQFLNSFVFYPLPLINWILFVPNFHHSSFSFWKIDIVFIAHIKINSCNISSNILFWIGSFYFEIDFKSTLAILPYFRNICSISIVISISINLSITWLPFNFLNMDNFLVHKISVYCYFFMSIKTNTI